MMDSKMLLKMLLKRFDVKGFLVDDLIKGALDAKLNELVANTENTLDDALKQIIMPQILKVIEDKLDDMLSMINIDDALAPSFDKSS